MSEFNLSYMNFLNKERLSLCQAEYPAHIPLGSGSCAASRNNTTKRKVETAWRRSGGLLPTSLHRGADRHTWRLVRAGAGSSPPCLHHVQARWRQCRWRLGAHRCMHVSTCACTMSRRGGGSAGGDLVHTGACASPPVPAPCPGAVEAVQVETRCT